MLFDLIILYCVEFLVVFLLYVFMLFLLNLLFFFGGCDFVLFLENFGFGKLIVFILKFLIRYFLVEIFLNFNLVKYV